MPDQFVEMVNGQLDKIPKLKTIAQDQVNKIEL